MSHFEIDFVTRDDIPDVGTDGTGKWEPLRAAICRLIAGGDAVRFTIESRQETERARSAASNLSRERLEKTGATRIMTRKKVVDPDKPLGTHYLWVWLEV